MIDLPESFIQRMKKSLGNSAGEFFASYNLPPCKGIRVNDLKISVEDFKKISPFSLEEVPWEECGFYVNEEKAGKTVLHAAGLYYVQEPSAMSAAPLLDVRPGERVLDMCSAPGGKGTRLAQKMRGEGVIILNEVNFSRAKILSQNVERLGITNAAVISASPEDIAARMGGYFDKILVDAPCSGEGMFRKDSQAVAEWSPQSVLSCAARQRLILSSAAKALKAGGKLVYSTCTFAPEEDEEQVESFLKEHPEFSLIEMKKLLPHECRGEGHFVALLQKGDGEICDAPQFKPVCDKKSTELYRLFEREYVPAKQFSDLHLAGDVIYSIPSDFPALPFRTLRAGVRLCEIKTSRAEPSHSLAMCLTSGDAASVEVDGKTAISYLSGNAIACNEKLSGWALVTHLGYPLGWCKAVEGVAKNHLPKGLRI